MARFKAILGFFYAVLIVLCAIEIVKGYNEEACCNLAKNEGAFVGLVSPCYSSVPRNQGRQGNTAYISSKGP